jgi:hypothetical protein
MKFIMIGMSPLAFVGATRWVARPYDGMTCWLNVGWKNNYEKKKFTARLLKYC